MNGKRPGGWVALAWRYYRDPKFTAVSGEAELLWLHALVYCGEQDTDGKVPRNLLESLRKHAPNLDETDVKPGPKRATTLARQLVRAGLWVETAEGFAFPLETWSRWQDTSEQRAVTRVRTAERQAKFRDSRRVTRRVTNRTAGEGEGEGAVLSTATPFPLHAVQGRVASQDQDPDTWVDEHGYLFVGRPPDDNGSAS